MPWLSWVIRHAAWLHTRFHKRRGQGNLTAWERLRNMQYNRPILTFGECVYARRPGVHRTEFASQHVVGVWLGKDAKTDEDLVGTAAGIVRSRPYEVRRKTEAENGVVPPSRQ